MGRKKKDVDTLIVAEALDLLCMKKNVVFAKDKAIKVSSCISSTQKWDKSASTQNQFAESVLDKHIK